MILTVLQKQVLLIKNETIFTNKPLGLKKGESMRPYTVVMFRR